MQHFIVRSSEIPGVVKVGVVELHRSAGSNSPFRNQPPIFCAFQLIVHILKWTHSCRSFHTCNASMLCESTPTNVNINEISMYRFGAFLIVFWACPGISTIKLLRKVIPLDIFLFVYFKIQSHIDQKYAIWHQHES